MRELFGGFALMLGAGVLLVYVVLVLLFGGFLQPLTIMSALPLSPGGALMVVVINAEDAGDRGRRRRADADGHRGEELDPVG
jgi:HAE1 family hydrophobic/amphiphilic exporter-1